MQNPYTESGGNIPQRDRFDFAEKASSFVAKTGAFMAEEMTEAPHRCHD
jgi:hypothetical protein